DVKTDPAAASVRDSITTVGWPDINASRGKVIFVLSNNENYTQGANTDLVNRVCFTSCTLDSTSTDQNCGIILYDQYGYQQSDEVRDQINEAVSQGFLIRIKSEYDYVPNPPNEADSL